MSENIITVRYGPKESGPAELLDGKLARIIDAAILEGPWKGDIVRLSHTDDPHLNGFPTIEKVVVERFCDRSYVHVGDEDDVRILATVLPMLNADIALVYPPRDGKKGLIIVAHHDFLDPVALAAAIGIDQGDETGSVDEDAIKSGVGNRHPNAISKSPDPAGITEGT